MALTNKYLINGLLAPFLLVAILIIAANKKLMQAYDRMPRQPFVHKTG
jgi:Mn2+/Fe2+ NRAMP family transporter